MQVPRLLECSLGAWDLELEKLGFRAQHFPLLALGCLANDFLHPFYEHSQSPFHLLQDEPNTLSLTHDKLEIYSAPNRNLEVTRKNTA